VSLCKTCAPGSLGCMRHGVYLGRTFGCLA
jgi:hypothetical protein